MKGMGKYGLKTPLFNIIYGPAHGVGLITF